MSKTLTIIINNIQEKPLAKLWKHNIKNAKKTLGISISRTDRMEIDFDVLSEAYEEDSRLAELLTEALYCHTIMEGHKILNP